MRGIIKISTVLALVLFSSSLFCQNSPPVATGEEVYPIFNFDVSQNDTTINVNLLLNDFDPEGNPIEIAEIRNRTGQEFAQFTFSDSTISLTMSQTKIIEQAYDYRVREKDDTLAVSNWATLIFNPVFGPDYPVARNDTITIYPVSNGYINVLKNDFHPLGDSLFIETSLNSSDSSVLFHFPYYNDDSVYYYHYFLTDTSPWNARFDQGRIYIKIEKNEWYDSLDINNINARFNCINNNFWDLDDYSHFKVPNGSNIRSLFCQTLWIGGLDDNDNLHLAGDRYRQVGADYWYGPISSGYDSIYDSKWYHVWKLNRSEIEYHKSHWWEAGYLPLEDILTWPGNGHTDLGQSDQIAPFEDNNNNGIYEPMHGDAPIIKGDQALFFVFNDAKDSHTETEGVPLGIEVHAMAYAFDAPEDSTLWNTVFFHYDIINRSDTNYHDMYLGLFTDTDLGYSWDDRIESDVANGMYFTYNGTEYDEGGFENPGYGEHPPAMGIQILGGPFLDDDGIDNPKYDLQGNQIVDESINGMNFSDGIIDNERMGMTNFVYFSGGGGAWMGDPDEAPEYYDMMQAIWPDETKMQYGGYGHATALAEGPDANFMWPRDTDPWNWGTYGLWPNGGWNQNNYYWTEEVMGAIPNDRKGVGSSGPFIFNSGQGHSLDVALIWARDYDGTAWSSAELLKERAAGLKDLFQNNPGLFMRSKLADDTHPLFKIYPNPTTNKVCISIPGNNTTCVYCIYDILGNKLLEGKISKPAVESMIDISRLNKGNYILKIVNDNGVFSQKIIKY
ncbi:MAG: T9SS type A sorting domain-containing protein [Bacteroidales bacterium]|nr:T9SS type A sorting domain-containing protein [Bacteroidales bacterium]MCF8404463.1 T9SS type A sorting domain-containing protein [Bacteroidales bacterium]